uniref:DUF4153 domain-containing protein n=1 Tax=Caenorhabditis tropicalis TaxID=1561998 RepID=A0A1I7UN78_9PELO
MRPELDSTPSESKLWTIAPIVFSLVYLTVAAFYSWETILTATIILSVWIILFGFFAIVRKCMKKDIQDQKGEYRKDLLIGLTGICVISWAVRIAVLIDPFNDEFFFLSVFSTPLAFFLFYKVFIYKSRKECQLFYKSTDKLPWIVLFLNIIGLIVTGELTLAITWESVRTRLFWAQLVFGLVGGITMLEFCYLWCGRFKLKGEEYDTIEGNVKTVEKKCPKFQKYMVNPIKRLFYMKLEEPYPELTITDVIPRVYILVFPPIALIGLVLMGFGYWDSYMRYWPKSYFLIISIICTWGLVYGGFIVYEKYLKAKFDLSKKKELLIGLSGGLVAAWIPRIAVLFYLPKWVFLYLNFICPLLFILFYLHFTVEGKKKWRVVYNKSDKVPMILLIVNVIHTLFLIGYKLSIPWRCDGVWCQLAFMAICTLNSIELCQVWNGMIESGASEKKIVENLLIDKKPLGVFVHKSPKKEMTYKRSPSQQLSSYLDGKP